MKKNKVLLLLVLTASTLIIACSGEGEKVTINEKSDVFLKDGATKEEGQKLGSFLLQNNYFDNATDKSVQLSKENDAYVVKFVVNEEKLKNDEEAILGFRFFQTLIKDSVFAGKPTKLFLTDAKFNVLKPVKEFSHEELSSEEDSTHEREHGGVDTTTAQ
jgi:hypothetical protein